MSPTPPPQAEPTAPVEAPQSTPPESRAESSDSTAPAQRGLTVVIEDPEGSANGPGGLVAAAQAERKRRQETGGSKIVITDKNLKEHATGQLTEMGNSQGRTPEAAPKPPVEQSSEPAPPASEPNEEPDPEAYWRGRVLGVRMNWASAVEEIEHLSEKITELRQRFYAEDDPYYRDSQIKPSWDRALDRLEEAKAAAENSRRELAVVLEEGRRAGALPGWLREGLDLEPEDTGRESVGPPPPGEYEPGEPKIAKDPDGRR